ncbi:MAG: hypothetical protein H6Q90_2061 [Deltaproteobacteria bacterium]|nr:hypothetical protein [Deltaproteobacteria bacterium]
MATNGPSKRPADELRAIAAPTDLIEWVRKLAPDSETRSAWVDATRADWVPYLAVLRGISRDTILRAACECALEKAEPSLVDAGPESARVLEALRAAAARGRDGLATADADLADLRLAIIQSNHDKGAVQPPWMFWAELVLELSRASARGNPLIGVALAMKMLATSRPGASRSRSAQHELVGRLRDKLTAVG